jgi:hypothetical protein
MSYFSIEKKSLVSISAITTNTTQTIQTSAVAVSIFNGAALTQMASSIKYPTITVSSNVFSLEGGWKYIIHTRFKANNVDGVTTTYLRYYLSSGGATISSIGTMPIFKDISTQTAYAQEGCMAYIDARASAQTFSIFAQRVGGSSAITLNGDAAGINAVARSYVLIKAWK